LQWHGEGVSYSPSSVPGDQKSIGVPHVSATQGASYSSTPDTSTVRVNRDRSSMVPPLSACCTCFPGTSSTDVRAGFFASLSYLSCAQLKPRWTRYALRLFSARWCTFTAFTGAKDVTSKSMYSPMRGFRKLPDHHSECRDWSLTRYAGWSSKDDEAETLSTSCFTHIS